MAGDKRAVKLYMMKSGVPNRLLSSVQITSMAENNYCKYFGRLNISSVHLAVFKGLF